MMKLKKVVFLILLTLCALWVTNCAQEQKESTEQSETEKAPKEEVTEDQEKDEKISVGVSIYRYDDNYMKLYREELMQYLVESYGADVTMRNARNDRQEQAGQVKEFLEAGCDAVIVNLVDERDGPVIADQCSQAGIPIVFINREPDEAEQERWKKEKMRVSYIGTDSRQAGTYQGEIILETADRGDINGDGEVSYVMIMGEEENQDAAYRTEYSIRALEEGGMKTRELYRAHGDWEQARGKEIAARALSIWGNRVEVLFCNNDAMCNGALEAAQEAGRIPGKDIYLVGVDALENTVKSVKEGRITGTVLNDHTGQSHLAADVAVKLMEGGKVQNHYNVDYLKITTVSTFEQ